MSFWPNIQSLVVAISEAGERQHGSLITFQSAFPLHFPASGLLSRAAGEYIPAQSFISHLLFLHLSDPVLTLLSCLPSLPAVAAGSWCCPLLTVQRSTLFYLFESRLSTTLLSTPGPSTAEPYEQQYTFIPSNTFVTL